MTSFWQCLFSPRLYMIYRDGARNNKYRPDTLERWGDRIITSAHTIMKIGLYTSPFICMYIYKRDYTFEQKKAMLSFFTGVGCLIVLSYMIRGYGRARNPKYMKFVNTLNKAFTEPVNVEGLLKYDFEFHAWPVTYKMAPIYKPFWRNLDHPFSTSANADLPFYHRIIVQQLAFIAVHTFGLRLIYPGCLDLIRLLMWEPLQQGRTQLVEGFNGKRAKICTADGNTIDTMFVDNRKTQKGKTLVICCEGNSGFYEVGIMTTPIKAGYSALGWNHPGFAGSTGLPYPSQEQNAMDAVMQYAIDVLGFNPEDIVLFGWSIGGYAATWGACKYPIKCLVLDATFDDLLPLAIAQMPASWARLVREVVRSYVNLDIATLLKGYKGPIKVIRRTEDEIICLRQRDITTNRGNNLLISIITHRYPKLFEEQNLKDMLNRFVALIDYQRTIAYRNDIPLKARELLHLISKYMHDYKSSHCTPLPEDHFQLVMDTVMTNVAPNQENTQSEN